MNASKRMAIALLGVIILVMTLACGGSSTPVPIGDIPVYPGASTLASGDDPIVDIILEAMEESAAEDENIDAEFALYSLPEDAAWADVKSFYMEKMEADNWKAAEDITEESDVFNMIGWEKSKQAIGVGYIPAGMTERPTLLIMLATEK